MIFYIPTAESSNTAHFTATLLCQVLLKCSVCVWSRATINEKNRWTVECKYKYVCHNICLMYQKWETLNSLCITCLWVCVQQWVIILMLWMLWLF